MDECERVSFRDYAHENPDLNITSVQWDPHHRVYLCTDQQQIIQIDSQTLREEHTFTCASNPTTFVITLKHVIIALEEGLIEWHLCQHPELQMI